MKNGRAKEQNVESTRRIPFGKFLNYACNISVCLKLIQNKKGPLCFFFFLKVQYALYLPKILSPSSEISTPFTHFPSSCAGKRSITTLETSA